MRSSRYKKEIQTLQDLKDEIIQSKGFQKLPSEVQFEILQAPYLEHLYKVIREIILLN